MNLCHFLGFQLYQNNETLRQQMNDNWRHFFKTYIYYIMMYANKIINFNFCSNRYFEK